MLEPIPGAVAADSAFPAGGACEAALARADDAGPVGHLYVHVPFCAHKCEYCAFYSEVAQSEVIDRYVTCLAREMASVAGDLRSRTIYFGGGTPSLLSWPQWESVLKALERQRLLGAEEWTVECNPATVSGDKARLLRDHGVNRISLGVQSFDDALLGRLGRVHRREQVFQAFEVLRRAGFANANIDLMFGIPGQTMAQWRATLGEALALDTEHLSAYEVTYEEDTGLFEQLQAGQFAVDEDLVCDMLDELVSQATARGFSRYEVANFAKQGGATGAELPAFACRHNVNYWRGGAFYGLGPSATSYVRGVRTRNWADTARYCDSWEHGQRAVESTERLSPWRRAGETAAFGLRMKAGWPFEEFRRVTGYDLRGEWAADMADLERQGMGETLPDRFRLTDQGLRFADLAAQAFLRL